MNTNKQPQLHEMIDDLETKINQIKMNRQDLMTQKQTTLKHIFQPPQNTQTQHQPLQSTNPTTTLDNNITGELTKLNKTVQKQTEQITDLRRQLTNSNIEIQNLKDQMQQMQQKASQQIEERRPQQPKTMQNKKSNMNMFQDMEDRFNQQFNQMKNMMDQQMGTMNRQNQVFQQRTVNFQGGDSDMMKAFQNDSFFNRSSNNQQQQQWNSHQSQNIDNQQKEQNDQQPDDQIYKTQILGQSTNNVNRNQQENEDHDENDLIDDHDKENQQVSNINKSKNQRKDFMNSFFNNKNNNNSSSVNGGSIISMSQVNQGLKVYKIIEQCKSNKKKYLDKDFEANIDSISTEYRSEEYNSFKNCKWLRPQEMFKNGKPIKVFDNISVNDIKQGSLGVCYLLATLSGLAEYPHILKKSFNIQEYNKYGCYSVNIFIQGKKQEIVIDDLFPCLDDKPVFAKPEGNELWVLILEKAWCKLYGEYSTAQGGFPNVSQEHLTGAPGLMYSDSNQPEYWQTEEKMAQTLMDWEANKYLMGAGTRGQGEVQNEQGMVSGHAYTILGVYKWKGDYLIKLRNPWGFKEFKGKYDEDNDYIWQDEQLKQLTSYVKKDDGIFYMTIGELQENMDIISCCKEKPDYDVHQVFDLDLKSNEYAYFTFELSNPQQMNFRIHQRMKQMINNDDDYKCSPVVFNIYKIDDSAKIELVSSGDHYRRWGNYSINHSDEHYTEFKAGKYVIEVTVCWNDHKYPLVMNYYSRKKVGVKQVESSSTIEQLKSVIYNYYEQYAASLATDNGEYLKLNSYHDNAIILMYFKNKNQSFKLSLNFVIDNEEHYFDTPNGPRMQVEGSLENGEHLFALVRPRKYYAKVNPQVKSQMKFV